jgi:hypothetical protein
VVTLEDTMALLVVAVVVLIGIFFVGYLVAALANDRRAGRQARAAGAAPRREPWQGWQQAAASSTPAQSRQAPARARTAPSGSGRPRAELRFMPHPATPPSRR